MTQFPQSAIQRLLPHRYPLLLVDWVSECVPGKRIVGFKNFTANGAASQGYSPSAPFIPLGILLEVAAQLGAVLILESPQMSGKVPVMLGIPRARMLAPVLPGDTLRVEAEVKKLGESFGELRGAGYRGEELVAEGLVRFAIALARDLSPEQVDS